MRHYFSALSVLALGVMGVLAPNVKASEWDKKTNITINKSIEVEGTVLPAGSYVLKLVDSPSERYLVRILNTEENRVIATVFTTPLYKFRPADNSEFKFYESENGQPPALHTWFYPGESVGFEFKASRGNAVESAQGASATASSAATN
jgi:hypothetical protein